MSQPPWHHRCQMNWNSRRAAPEWWCTSSGLLYNRLIGLGFGRAVIRSPHHIGRAAPCPFNKQLIVSSSGTWMSAILGQITDRRRIGRPRMCACAWPTASVGSPTSCTINSCQAFFSIASRNGKNDSWM